MFASRLLSLYSGYAKSAARLMSAVNHAITRLIFVCCVRWLRSFTKTSARGGRQWHPQPTCSFCLRDFPCLRNDFGFDISRLFGPVDAVTGPHNPLSGFVLGDHKKPHCLRFSLASCSFAFAVPRTLVVITTWCHLNGGRRIGPVIDPWNLEGSVARTGNTKGASCTPHLHKLR
jgi:hypothetical protein